MYPVISRRAGGVSIGVNLNPDRRCTFACVYCQVDRSSAPPTEAEVDLDRLAAELDRALSSVGSGDLWKEDRFAATPLPMRRLRDVAFSGDGEPTSRPNFDRAVAVAAEALRRRNLAGDVKVVVITNASCLDQPQVRRALPILDACGGEFWIKLDAGTEEEFRRVNRPAGGMTLADIHRNILSVAKDRPVVIQTLLFRTHGRGPEESEWLAYCRRLRDLQRSGAKIRLVQIHTVARSPAEAFVSYLPETELRELSARIAAELPSLEVETYPGLDVPPQHKT